MKKLTLLLLFIGAICQAQTRVYTLKVDKWAKVTDSVQSKLYRQGGDTLATKAYVRERSLDTTTIYQNLSLRLKNIDTTTRTKVLTRKATDSLINYALTGVVDTKGNWSVAGGLLPTTSAIGDKYTITNGTVFITPDSFYTGDIIIAKTINAGQTVANWNHIYANQPKSVNLVRASATTNPAVLGYTGITSTPGYIDGGTTNPQSIVYRGNFNFDVHASKITLNSCPSTAISINNGSNNGMSIVTASANGLFSNTATGTSIYGQVTSNGSALKADISSSLSNNSNGTLLDLQRVGSHGNYNITGNFISILDNPITSGMLSGKIFTATIGITERISLNPRVLDGGDAYTWDTHNTLTYGNLVVWKNAGSTKASIDYAGYLHNYKPTFSSVFYDSTRVIELDQNTPKIISNTWGNLWPNTKLVGFTENKDTAIVSYAGNYNLTFDFNSNVSASANFHYYIKKRAANSTTKIIVYRKEVSNSGTTVNRNMTLNYDFSVGDRIWIEVENISNGQDITVYGGTYSITANYLNP